MTPVEKRVAEDVVEKPFIKRASKNVRKYKAKKVDATAPLGVLEFEINELAKDNDLTNDMISNDMKLILNDESVLPIYHREVEDVEILKLTSNGDGLGIIPHPQDITKKQIVIVPFGLPGDVVTIRVFKSHPSYVESDLLSIQKSSEYRDDSLINCKYFGKCSGCQYQNISYDQQLEFKRKVIENAYKFFAKEISDKLPEVDKTEPSPLQYNYRTKLTPHFNLPNSIKNGKPLDFLPPLGFAAKGRPQWRSTEGGDNSILDIEECSIGTPIINKGMANERLKYQKTIKNYKKGATILLRENTRLDNEESINDINPEKESVDEKGDVTIHKQDGHIKTCATNSRYIVNEIIDNKNFKFSAGEFFQNNNSILPAVTNYVKSNLSLSNEKPNYLIDAYCGSGLFSITCSSNVEKVIGVEVSADSVKFAKLNADANNIQNSEFIVGKAEKIFQNIDLPSSQTSIILDPPRKGCDDVFLNQLSDFNPAKIIYISCNVHSQARDLQWFLNNTANGHLYKVDSIKGFDFFPQTHHVESVAVLSLK
ncbi:tRNA (uracil(54)-C(5))-methyltransferase [[Candida] jaroonii]|uniref:tRNA (Uracil(54)-C(5))-methyltransferase n=1 Tax=[Candida] jaroonii TaxID=467808 RepID=A0ACA9YC44_9ASCO|nr:tRNA (uracil(54)-C(5))-methyltransferase [[Candida] jaroonii]